MLMIYKYDRIYIYGEVGHHRQCNEKKYRWNEGLKAVYKLDKKLHKTNEHQSYSRMMKYFTWNKNNEQNCVTLLYARNSFSQQIKYTLITIVEKLYFNVVN